VFPRYLPDLIRGGQALTGYLRLPATCDGSSSNRSRPWDLNADVNNPLRNLTPYSAFGERAAPQTDL
jgi:hypothetical protein